MEWTKGKYKLVFNHIGWKWGVTAFRAGAFETSFIQDFRSWSVGVAFDRWDLSKQLTLTFLTLSWIVTWYSGVNKDWEL